MYCEFIGLYSFRNGYVKSEAIYNLINSQIHSNLECVNLEQKELGLRGLFVVEGNIPGDDVIITIGSVPDFHNQAYIGQEIERKDLISSMARE